MILKARPANGSSSEARRSPILPFSSSPLTGGISVGAGMKSITASSIACTPLFLNAEPQSIGTISLAIVRVRSPSLISSTESSPPSRYLFISVSLASAAFSTIFSRHSLAESRSPAGISRRSNFLPCDASSQQMAFIRLRPPTRSHSLSAQLGLLLHPVHDGRAVVHFAYLVRDARVEKDAFGGRGLAGINVGTDADVAIPVDGRRTCHKLHNLRKFSGDINSTRRA